MQHKLRRDSRRILRIPCRKRALRDVTNDRPGLGTARKPLGLSTTKKPAATPLPSFRGLMTPRQQDAAPAPGKFQGLKVAPRTFSPRFPFAARSLKREEA